MVQISPGTASLTFRCDCSLTWCFVQSTCSLTKQYLFGWSSPNGSTDGVLTSYTRFNYPLSTFIWLRVRSLSVPAELVIVSPAFLSQWYRINVARERDLQSCWMPAIKRFYLLGILQFYSIITAQLWIRNEQEWHALYVYVFLLTPRPRTLGSVPGRFFPGSALSTFQCCIQALWDWRASNEVCLIKHSCCTVRWSVPHEPSLLGLTEIYILRMFPSL